jgi:hypothetical protein
MRSPQLRIHTLFNAAPDKAHRLSDALARLNDQYREFVVMAALIGMDNLMLDRLAFGNQRVGGFVSVVR